MAKTRKSNTEFEMNTGANESVAKASKKKERESTEKGVGEVVQLPGGYTKRRSRGNDRKINLSVSPELHKRIRDVARDEDVSMNLLVSRVMIEWLDREGY